MTRSRSRGLLTHVLIGVGVLIAGTFLTSAASADEFVDRVNAAVRKADADKRSDLVLLPLLPDMQEPPAVYSSQYQAALFGSRGPSWDEAKAWAEAEPQKKVVEAMAKITRDEDDPRKAFVFGLPYGADAAGPDVFRTGLFAELGDPPLLAAVQLHYMDKLETVGVLMHVEASRIAETGDLAAAMETMKQWLLFTRQIADRPFLKEKKWAMESMLLALERLCDLAYVDFRADKHSSEPAKLRDLVNLLRERSLFIDRIRLPEGDIIARQQLVSLVFDGDGPPDPDMFGRTMARIAASERPLRLFSAAAFWDQARLLHADGYDTKQLLNGLDVDWQRRWRLPAFDPFQTSRSVWDLRVNNRPQFAVIATGLDGIPSLFTLRRKIDAYQSGGRMALAAYGYFLREKTIPPNLAAVAPAFTRTLDRDPYSSRGQDIRYFRPELDTPKDDRGNAKPYELHLFPAPPRPELRVRLDSSHFVVYSIGPDDKNQMAFDCTQGQEGLSGDYLFWPPELSLERQRLIDTGELR